MSLLHEDDLPILNAVVESGNPSLIQSARLGNEVLRELESLRQEATRGAPSLQSSEAESDTLSGNAASAEKAPDVEIPQGMDFAAMSHDSSEAHNDEATDPLLDGPVAVTSATNDASDANEAVSFKDDEIERMIDDIVDRHVTALRHDIKQLLERARSSP